MLRYTAGIGLVCIALAGCDMEDGSTSAAVPIEQVCAGALAEQANVSMGDIVSRGSQRSGEGTIVYLVLNGANWNCAINDNGEVTQLEFQGEG